MGKLKLLDCTLRDGAYVNDAIFGDKNIINIVNGLIDAGVEIIECGWLKNDESKNDSTYFHIPSDINKYNFEKKNSKFSLMIDYNRYDFKDLTKNDISPLDIVRITFPIDHISDGLDVAKKFKSYGVDISFQLINAKAYIDSFKSKEFINDFINRLNDFKPICISLADTFGSMFPKDIEYLVMKFDECLDSGINIGLHTHNNMNLAFANTIKFVEISKSLDRDVVVDGSLLGMGRGAGNTPTEVLIDYLNKYENKHYDIDVILTIIDKYMIKYHNDYKWGYSPYLAVAGMMESHINNVLYLRDRHNISVHQLKEILSRMNNTLKSKYAYEILEKIYNENN